MSDEMVELAYAYAQDKVSLKQVAFAIGKKQGHEVYPVLVRVLQFMVLTGLLVADGWLKEE